MKSGDASAREPRCRLDKWLWAARFFKTRALAAEAVDGGRVQLAGRRVKPARQVRVDDRLTILRGRERFEIIVRALSDTRGPARVAQTLYHEPEDSRLRREAEREAQRLSAPPPRRPDKRERRQIHRFIRKGA